VAGTLALKEVFGDLPMDFVALCSSVTAVSGDFGQVDYCAANNFLDAYAHSDHGWQARLVSHNWGGWEEVGMAAEVAAPPALRDSGGEQPRGTVEHPILTTRTGNSCHGLVSPGSHWVLDEHRIGGVPVIPGTAHVETVRAAVAATVAAPGREYVVELRDVVFLEPFAVRDGATAEYRVEFDGNGFQVASRIAGAVAVHARGTAGWVAAPEQSTVDLDGITDRCTVLDDEHAFGRGRTSMVTFGPRWAALRRHHVGEREELAEIIGPEQAAADTGAWDLHPALLDVATSFGRGRGCGTYLPLSYGRLIVHAALPSSFHSHLTYRDTAGDEVIAADVRLCDGNGRVLVEIEDFVLRRVDENAVHGVMAGRSTSADVPTRDDVGEQGRGIRPADGVEAFLRALDPRLGPQVVISPRPVAELFDRGVSIDELAGVAGGEPTPAAAGGGADDDVVAPRTELETEIARQWAEVLGVDGIGVHDDFFALGGNSLVAIQLIAQVRKTTGARLAMKTLFEAPTVAALAERIEELAAVEADAATEDSAENTIPRIER
jgi:acyl carrier protein